jgi:hypothetical protein
MPPVGRSSEQAGFIVCAALPARDDVEQCRLELIVHVFPIDALGCFPRAAAKIEMRCASSSERRQD